MKVLVVDDSVVFRMAIKQALETAPEIKEVVTASNGQIAIDIIRQGSVDAVTLDLEMPVMDGIETIKNIREFNKNIPIIVFSSQNISAADKTLVALELGADDFVRKIEGSGNIDESIKEIQRELVPRFLILLKKRFPDHTFLKSKKVEDKEYDKFKKPNLICIGSSTGGPDALKKVLSNLRSDIKVPVIIVQHMPPVFTAQLATSLNKICALTVSEARDGDILKAGHCYMAPGDYHLTLKKIANDYVIKLDQTEKVCFVRPSVDVTLKSVADVFTGHVLTCILTGMGQDGMNGTKNLKSKLANVIIQDEETSVVWGMPKAVYDAKAYDLMLNINEVASAINRICR